VKLLEEARRRYRFVVVGYVVMPEHIHLLISEPEEGTPSTVMQVVKQRYAQRVLVAEPEQWAWSSYRSYANEKVGVVKINQGPPARLNGALAA